MQFGGALVVTPVTDPDNIAIEPTVARYGKNMGSGRFMPRPCTPCPAALSINFAQQIAVSQNAIIMRKIVPAHLVWCCHRAVMSVVKQKMICATLLEAAIADSANERGVVPFMNQNEIGALQCAIEIERGDVVRFRS